MEFSRTLRTRTNQRIKVENWTETLRVNPMADWKRRKSAKLIFDELEPTSTHSSSLSGPVDEVGSQSGRENGGEGVESNVTPSVEVVELLKKRRQRSASNALERTERKLHSRRRWFACSDQLA